MFIKKRILPHLGFFVMLVFSIHSKAQLYVGAEVGGNQNYLIKNVSSLNATEIVPKNGITLAAIVQYKFNDWFSVEATPQFIQKNYQIQRTGYYTGVYQRTDNNYLQLPVSAKFSFGTKKWKGFVDLGVYAAYWISSHIKGKIPNILDQSAYNQAYNPYVDAPTSPVVMSETIFDDYNPYTFSQKYQFDKIKDRRYELGLSAGLGVSYEATPKITVFAEFKYSDALTDQQKKYQYVQDAQYNETGSFLVGFTRKIHLHCKKKVSKEVESKKVKVKSQKDTGLK